jgi:hypothetical protein
MTTLTIHRANDGSGGAKPGNVCLKILYIALVFMAWSTLSTADSQPPRINVGAIDERYEPGVIKAMVMDDTGVSSVTLFYRKPGDVRYTSVEMKEHDDIWYRELKRDFGVSGTVEYYLLAQDRTGNESTEPAVNPTEQPLRAALDENVNQAADEVVLSSPEAGTSIISGDQLIIVTFYKTDREVDMGTVRIRIDDRDRTREAEIRGNMLIWNPQRPLPDGRHLVEIVARDTNGNNVGPNIWTFQVKSKLQLPLGTTGSFYMGFEHDDRSNDNGGAIPLWNNRIDLGLSGEKSWLSWEAGVELTSEDTPFLTTQTLGGRQPVNRYFATLRTRNLLLHFGDNNPSFSDLSVNGILVRGFGASVKSNRFNADFVYGYNQREIGQDVEIVQGVSNVTPTSYIDASGTPVDISSKPYQQIVQDPSDPSVYHVYEFSPGTFKRNVAALKLDTAPLRNRFFTWNVGFNLFSAEDDTTTLAYDQNTDRTFHISSGDSIITGYNPKKNWVGTFETSLRFNGDKSILSAEFGGTMVTDNMFGALTDDIKSEIPSQLDDKLFRFNGSTQTSFDKLKLKDNVGKGIADAVTSVYLVRLVTPLPIPGMSTRLKSELYRIPTHYVSLGNPHQRTDMGGYNVSVKTLFLKDQVAVDLGYETYSDNLDKERQQDANAARTLQKDLTKDTNTALVTVSLRPHVLPEYEPNVSVGYRTYKASNNLDLVFNSVDKQIDLSTNTLMVNFGATLPVGMQRHAGTLSFSNMDIADNRTVPALDKNESSNLTVMLNVNSFLNPLPLSINTTIGQTGNKSFLRIDPPGGASYRKSMTTNITMLNLAATYKWFRDKSLSTTAGIGYLGSSNGESKSYKVDNTKTSFRFDTEYKLSQMAAAGAQLRFVNYTDNARAGQNYTEPILGVTLRSNF